MIVRVVLLLVLAAAVLLFGLYLQNGFPVFAGHTYSLYLTGMIAGMLCAALTLEFPALVAEIRRDRGK